MDPAEMVRRSRRLVAELHQLCEQSRLLCAESQAIRAEAQRQQEQSPWPQDTPQLLVCVSRRSPEELAPGMALAIHELFDDLPIQWQVAVVKRLVEQTLQKRPIYVLSA